MNWQRVADYLDKEATELRARANSAFADDFNAQREMLTRAQIFHTFATALRVGHER